MGRALSRYGLHLTRADLAYIARLICTGRATFVMDSPADPKWSGIYRVTLRGVEVTVVYNRGRRAVVTVLPRGSRRMRDLAAEAEWAGKPAPLL